MSDWGQSAIGVGPAVTVAALVHLLLRTRILAVVEREVVESPVRWDGALRWRRVPQPGATPGLARLDGERGGGPG